MTHDIYKFIELVDTLRKTQRLYFKTRSPSVLEDSKRIEREVDNWIADFRNRQKELFQR